VRLHEEGLIYRGKRLVNWDPVLLTALSDLEVRHEEEDGISGICAIRSRRAPITRRRDDASRDDAGRHCRSRCILTTSAIARSWPADRAAAHGPHDPVIADAYVDPAFGSGCVKITPAHDFNDYEVGNDMRCR
jgi:valyl-tRNA synthetase